jgi:hypothetical protein
VARYWSAAYCGGPIEPHHEPPRSLGSGDDKVLALCAYHHEMRHLFGAKEFYGERGGFDPAKETAATEARWRAAQPEAAW